MSIQRKLTLTILGISLTAVMLTVMAITAYLIYDMRASKAQELRITAALTGDRNAAALAFLDNERLKSNLEIFRLNPSILTACIYDKQGALAAAYSGESDKTEMIACLKRQRPFIRQYRACFTAATAIEQHGDRVGSVFMAADMREVDAYVQKILIISVIVTLFVLLLTLLLTVHFQRTISRPILELAATAELITINRNYALEANIVSKDETGVLARAFKCHARRGAQARPRADKRQRNARAESFEAHAPARRRESESRGGKRRQERIPAQHVARISHAAACDHQLFFLRHQGIPYE